MAVKNPCSKTVTPEQAYEVWQSGDGSWTYFVLKKYQSPEKEATNPFARWYCMVQSPITPRGEYGDVYVATVKHGTLQIVNPLAHTNEPTTGKEPEPMKLLTEELKQQLPPLYSQEHEPDPLVICKFFHPLSPWTWYAYEGSPEGDDFLFFGWVNGDFPELGYFSLSELESVNVMGLGIERDLHFSPMRLSEVKQLHTEPPPAPPTLTIILIDDLEEEEDPHGNL